MSGRLRNVGPVSDFDYRPEPGVLGEWVPVSRTTVRAVHAALFARSDGQYARIMAGDDVASAGDTHQDEAYPKC
jgi:hypothetical protein